MIKDLISSALNSEGGSLLDSIGLPSDKKGKALDLAKDSILGGLTDSFTSGNIGEITKSFSSGGSSSLVQGIVSNYGSSLISKLGVNETIAKTVSSQLIPMVFKYINNRNDAPTDSDEGVKGLLGDLVGDGLKDKLGGFLKNKFKL
ncbi:hypothetical protein [Mangrovibacterium sp.]|uniref:hypothetical protein n=1 Tax=Mangrovibacterium sp. TaxID=1961364 RepID=UPI00356AB76C